MKIIKLKVFILLICPVVLIIGHIISFFLKDSLIINKDGVINVYFVKLGWFWTSLVCWWCIFRYSSRKFYWNSLIRYVLLSLWWFIFTQNLWFGIPPIMDIIFIVTGGHCSFSVFDQDMELNLLFQDSEYRRINSLRKLNGWLMKYMTGVENNKLLAKKTLDWINCRLNKQGCELDKMRYETVNHFITDIMDKNHNINNSNLCRLLGGHWIGGHDPSGHIFLITLMCMFLLGELQIFGKTACKKLKINSKVYLTLFFKLFLQLLDNGGFWNLFDSNIDTGIFIKFVVLPPYNFMKTVIKMISVIVFFIIWENPILLLIFFLCIWMWSFLITSIAFHTFYEQLTGLLGAYIVVILTYWYLY